MKRTHILILTVGLLIASESYTDRKVAYQRRQTLRQNNIRALMVSQATFERWKIEGRIHTGEIDVKLAPMNHPLDTYIGDELFPQASQAAS